MATSILSGVSPSFLCDETLHEAYELNIQSKNGKLVRFGELVAGKGDSITTILIFGMRPRDRPSQSRWLTRQI